MQRIGAPTPTSLNVHIVRTPTDLDELVKALSGAEWISLDTETTNVWPRWAEIVGYSFAWKEDEAWYVPVRAPEGEPCLDPKQTLAWIREYFGSLPKLEAPRLPDISEPRQEKQKRETRQYPRAPRPALAVAWHMPPRQTPE